MRLSAFILIGLCVVFSIWARSSDAQEIGLLTAPDPREIPLPHIETPLGKLPGVNELPARPEMPNPLVMNDGTPVTTKEQWAVRREEMKKILEYYAVGVAPPPPGNVKGVVKQRELIQNGAVEYRLVHLTFGPQESLSLDIGIYTPTQGGPFPVVISPSGSPPGAASLPRLPQGPGQGRGVNALLTVGPAPGSESAGERGGARAGGAGPAGGRGGAGGAEAAAARLPPLTQGFAVVVFNNNDCGEDTTLRMPDGTWAFRTTRFYPAYPGYDWGLLRGWAWGVSRIIDHLQTEPAIDMSRIVVTGVSRTGKSALVAGAFDERIALSAPVASSGGGTPAYRFSGAERGGQEGLSEMMRKYPNWFSPNLHEFWGQVDKLPFDQHWFMALTAPRAFIALEGVSDQNVNHNGVRQSFLAAQPTFEMLGVKDKLGVSWANRPHALVQGDWDAMFQFAQWHFNQKPPGRTFDTFPEK